MSLSQFLSELRAVLRGLRRRPVFSLVAAVSVVVAVALTAVVGQVAYQELRAPLPYADGDRLVAVWEIDQQQAGATRPASTPNLADWRRAGPFDSLAGTTLAREQVVDTPGGAEPVAVAAVTEGFFRQLGVRPLAGALFQPQDHASNAAVVMITQDLAERAFGGAEAAVGSRFDMSSRQVQVGGVLPADFETPEWRGETPPEMWFPLSLQARPEDRGYHWLSVIGRLDEGVGLAVAQSGMRSLASRLAADHPTYNRGYSARVVPLREALVGDRAEALRYAGLGLILFLALVMVNLSTLALGHFHERRREQAVRLALGADSGRLLASWTLEGVVLTVGSGLAGLFLADLGLRVLGRFEAVLGLTFTRFSLSPGTAGVVLVGCVLAGFAYAAVPWLRVRTWKPARQLAGGTAAGDPPRWAWVRQGFLAVEVALAVILLLAAGLLARSLWNLHQEPLGFSPDGLVAAQTLLPVATSSDDPRTAEALRGLLADWRRAPEVEAAGAVSALPLAGSDRVMEVMEPDQAAPETPWRAAVGVATPGYFEAAGIRLLEGRLFRDHELFDVVLVNRSFADTFLADGALDRALRMGNDADDVYRHVVGVVADVRQQGPAEAVEPQVYMPHGQRSLSAMTLVARSDDPTTAGGALRRVVAASDGASQLLTLSSGEELRADTFAARRLALLLAGACALCGLVLAVAGIAGLVAFSVARRRSELGLRLALGANRGYLLRTVLRQVVIAAAVGSAAGLAVALLAGRLLSVLLHGVSATDPWTYVVVLVLFLVVSVATAWWPARRVLSASPATSLGS